MTAAHPRTRSILEAYRRGEPVDWIMAEYGCAWRTVVVIARRNGLRRSNGRPRHPREADILAAYRRGDPVESICAEHRCVKTTVINIARRNGLRRQWVVSAEPIAAGTSREGDKNDERAHRLESQG